MERPKNAEVKAVHFEGEKETPVVLDTKAQGEETSVEQVSFDTESFSVFAIVGTTIEKTVLASDGNNYKITVTYGPETEIPQGAELAVEEILPDEKNSSEDDAATSSVYEEYVSKTENALGMEEGTAGYIRLFDISIVDKDNPEKKYQPAEGSSAAVRIDLADTGSFVIVTDYGLGENGLIDLTDTTEMTLAGMASGIYKLSETNAPSGYIILTKDIYFKVANGTVTLTDGNGDTKTYSDVSLLDNNTTIAVKNNIGASLPSTGGPGTGLFTVTGLILIAGACLLLCNRRKTILND